MSSTCTYVLSIIKHSTLCGGPLRQYRACVGMSSEWKSTDVVGSPSQYMIQPSGIPILSPVLFMHVGDPYIPSRRTFDLLWTSIPQLSTRFFLRVISKFPAISQELCTGSETREALPKLRPSSARIYTP